MTNETTASQPKSIGDDTLDAAMADPDQVPYLIVFDDNDRPNEIVIGGTRAQYRFEQISGSWNAHLFAKVQSNSRDDKRYNDNFRAPAAQAAATIQAAPEDFDTWQKNPYTLVLQKSIAEDYVPRSAGSGAHADDIAVDRFAAAMKSRMAEMRAKGRKGWDNPKKCAIAYLMQSLKAVPLSQPVDVGNYAMMLFNRAIWENVGYPDAATIQEPVMVAEPVGQAQTSAAIKTWREHRASERARLRDANMDDRGLPVQSYMEREIAELRAALTAQLADSVTPAAPMVADPAARKVPSNQELDELYESHGGHPADFAADVLERWGGWPEGVLGQGGSASMVADPAGVAVLEHDYQIEELFKAHQGRWVHNSYWEIEDADLHPFVRSVLALATTVKAVPSEARRQYYYKVDGCKADKPSDASCICWHDEGTGPMANRPYEVRSWRVAAPLADKTGGGE